MEEELYEQWYEVIDGEEILMAPRPRLMHLDVAGNIRDLFKKFLQRRRCKAYVEPDVFLGEHIFIPDVAVICDMTKLLSGSGVQGAPDLVVEVLSPSTKKYDLGRKKEIYEEYGVQEYWIVNPEDRSIICYILEDGRFVPREVGDEFSPYIFENMIVKKADIFEETETAELY